MKTQKPKTVIATAVVAGVIAAVTALPAQARLPESAEFSAPRSQDETIYRPTCWTEGGYERWLRCAATPDGVEEIHPRIRGGHRDP
jgi:hypothetical protein